VAYERQRGVGGERIARWQIARVFRLLGRHDEALAMQQQLETEHQRGGSSDAHVFDELALLHGARGEAAQAERYRERAARVRAGN
jgi:Flp pilus assembly protein TadD